MNIIINIATTTKGFVGDNTQQRRRALEGERRIAMGLKPIAMGELWVSKTALGVMARAQSVAHKHTPTPLKRGIESGCL